MAETDPHHPSGRQDAYLRACEGILRTHFGRRPFSAAANAIAQLQREEKQKLLSAEHSSVLRWYEALGRLRGRWFAPLTAAAALVVLSAGLFFYWHGRAPKPIAVGQFTTVMGAPKLHHTGKRSTLYALRSTPVRLGDRIETGDADKA